MSVELFQGAEIKPTDEVLEKVLGVEIFNVYRELLKIGSEEFDLTYEWDSSNKPGNWSCMANYEHKTIFWLKILDNSIKTTFYFFVGTEQSVFDLAIHEDIKERYRNETEIIINTKPLRLEINCVEQLTDFRKIVRYMKCLFFSRRSTAYNWRFGATAAVTPRKRQCENERL